MFLTDITRDSPQNPIVALFGLRDRLGSPISSYTLFLRPSLDPRLTGIQVFVELAADFFYQGFLTLTVVFAAVVNWCIGPRGVMFIIDAAYSRLLAQVFTVIPPVAVFLSSFFLFILFVYVSRKFFVSPVREPHTLGTVFGVLLIFGFLLSHPLYPLQKIIAWTHNFTESVNAPIIADTATVRDSSNPITDTFITPLTHIINFHSVLSGECAQQWAAGLQNGTFHAQCLTAAQRSATQPWAMTLILVVVAALAAIPVLYYAVTVIDVFVSHMIIASWFAVSLVWVSAATLLTQRPFEKIGACLSRALGHACIAAVTAITANVLPVAFFWALSRWWGGWSGRIEWVSSESAVSYKGHRFPMEIINHCVWLYFRFPLSFREIEEMMLARGVVVSHESIRRWCTKFGQAYANQLRRRRPRPGARWHLDEVFIKIRGVQRYLWRAVDEHGAVLDVLVTSRRNAKAAKRFLRKLVKGLCYVPKRLITDKLASYPVAHREVMASVRHRRSRYLNNRAENSHQPTRQRERAMKRFTSMRHAQRFLAAHGPISTHFRPRRHLLSAAEWRTQMSDRFTEWHDITTLQSAA